MFKIRTFIFQDDTVVKQTNEQASHSYVTVVCCMAIFSFARNAKI